LTLYSQAVQDNEINKYDARNPELTNRSRFERGPRIAAINDHRSVANLIEILIRQHCEEKGIPILEQQEMFGDDNE